MSDPRLAAASFARGAVDLSGLKTSNAAATPPGGGTPAAGAGGGASVIDVTEATFQSEVLERSLHTLVVVDFWAEWCEPCKQLSPVLEKLAVEADGRWVLAKVDVDANQRIAAAFRVQGIPMVYAVLGGQPADVFQGVMPENQIRQWIDALLQAAEKAGITGGEAPPAEQPVEELADPAQDALATGDFDGAEQIYQQILAEQPGDAAAEAGLAQVRLLRRTEGLDPDQVIADAADHPQDLERQARAADVEVISGLAAQAYARLVDLVRRTSGEQRDAVRAHLISLFAIAAPDDPTVVKARRDLANALF